MKKSPALALLLAWLVPGAGHLYIGHRVKALVFCFVLVTMFAAGVMITDGGCVNVKPAGVARTVWSFGCWRVTRSADCRKAYDAADPGRHPLACIIQGFAALPAGTAWLASRGAPEFQASKAGDLGMLLTLVAGALNVLLMADALFRCGREDAKEPAVE